MALWIFLIIAGIIIAMVGIIAWVIRRNPLWWHWVLIGLGAVVSLIGAVFLYEHYSKANKSTTKSANISRNIGNMENVTPPVDAIYDTPPNDGMTELGSIL